MQHFMNSNGVAVLDWVDTLRNKQLEFWIKWTATPMALIHVYVTAHDVYPWYKWTGIVCAALWLWLGYLWRQPSLVVLNAIMVAIYLKGILGL
jgi:hypothetical protein